MLKLSAYNEQDTILSNLLVLVPSIFTTTLWDWYYYYIHLINDKTGSERSSNLPEDTQLVCAKT